MHPIAISECLQLNTETLTLMLCAPTLCLAGPSLRTESPGGCAHTLPFIQAEFSTSGPSSSICDRATDFGLLPLQHQTLLPDLSS